MILKSSKNKSATSDSSGKKTKPKLGLIAKLWIIFGCFVGLIVLAFVLMYNGVIGYMPDIEELKNPTDRYASILYTADGKEMGRYFQGSGNRVSADFDEISDHVINALIATEDARFMEHSGIDYRALMRVGVKTLLMQDRSAGGGSTLTQQLAKQLYSSQTSNAFTRALQKPIEWMIALKLERFYSKEEILKMYLNQFDFLYNAVGIRSAAQVYFGKEPNELNLEEAALLVGMVKNPSIYNPIRHPERAKERRNVVFEQMQKAGMLTASEVASLKEIPVEVNFHRVDHKDGIAPYVREQIRYMMRAKKPDRANYKSWEQAKFFSDSIEWIRNPLFGWIEKNPKPDGSKYDIYNDGLKIYTSIDSRMQQHAEAAVSEHLGRTLQPAFNREKRGTWGAPYSANRTEISEVRVKHLINQAIKQSDRWRNFKAGGMEDAEIRKTFDVPTEMKVFTYSGAVDTVMTPLDSILYHKSFLRTGFMAMDPVTGHILAYVGGPDFKFFQYDMVSLGRRQVGSTIKPFLYSLAMEEGYTPCDRILNAPPRLYNNGKLWSIRSGRSRAGGMVDLKWALTTSNNWISARLIDQLSPGALVRTLRNFGVSSPLDVNYTLALGSADISVKEMVGAYSAFANKGMRVDPILVTAIADNKGNIISEFVPKHTEVLSEKGYYRMLSMLQSVVNNGTGKRLRGGPWNISAQMGGKTGTTNYNADGWFMGFTPEIVAGAWVGGEERFIHFLNGSIGQGASMALPIWGLFMKKIYADPSLHYSQATKFQVPENLDLCDNDFVPSLGVGGSVEPIMEEVVETTTNDAAENEPDSEFFD
ncbi:MAG: transglycosylase domain-containing protein [Firmicutes bacterium]|nr:transglycosylase domain-containing protein [Bacillota bacterium]MCM1400443.1 transglycosylase domain-containing protein [Bacteroides sp.]MCM1476917.1 transglycosylase domain-containing protein [Bacteroides sp.]